MPKRPPEREKILIIKLAGQKSFLRAVPKMAAIRQQNPDAHITLLTLRDFNDLASRSGYVDDIWNFQRPGITEPDIWAAQLFKIVRGRFSRVYDLQNSARSSFYMRFSGLWSKRAEVPDAGSADMSWLRADISLFDVKPPYVLMAPGSAAAYKRWPAARYGGLALKLERAGIRTVLIGGDADRVWIDKIKRLSSNAVDLSGRTSLYDVAMLAEGALAAVGGDTAPMHVLAMKNIPVVILSPDTDSEADAPRGGKVVIIHSDDLSAISLGDVYKNLPVNRR